MSRTTEQNERTGELFPKKSRRKPKDQKYFGHRYGEGEGKTPVRPEAKKGVDFVMYGYPLELRHKSVIKQKIQDDIDNEQMKEI